MAVRKLEYILKELLRYIGVSLEPRELAGLQPQSSTVVPHMQLVRAVLS